MSDEVRPVPPGCEEAPGYILELFDGEVWLTQSGGVTTEWNTRGVWPTPEAAQAALSRAFENKFANE